MLKKIIGIGLVAAIVLFGLIQLIPYGRNHTNPPVLAEPKWDAPATRELAQRACFDCHSNETVWPWYSNVAPISWLVVKDTEEGRNGLNFSEWGTRRNKSFTSISKIVSAGGMPPGKYTIIHTNARLSSAERTQFLAGLSKSLQ